MHARLRLYLLIALLLVVPMQGTAAVLHAPGCGAGGSAAAASMSEDPHHTAAMAHDHGVTAHDDDRQPGSGDHAQHPCCQQASAASTVHVSPAPADLAVYLSVPPSLEVTFILEQPQRPPRA